MISRRDFLKKVGIGAGGAVVAKTLPAPVQPEMPMIQAQPPVLTTSVAFIWTGTAVLPAATEVFTYLPSATREDI